MACEHGWKDEVDCEVCRPPPLTVAALRSRVAILEGVIRKHHEWHCDYDDIGRYPESDLCETTMAAVAGLRDPSKR